MADKRTRTDINTPNHKARLAQWRKDNPDKVKAHRNKSASLHKETVLRRNLKYHYGITLELYNEFLASQNGLCAICHKTCISGRKLAVDHDHDTNKIRGLLCSKCNTGIGLFEDNVILLENAIAYLRRA